ncbi:hypothetical protein EW146_g8680 [Bondarzewia mesenterica]|uniref:BHLH domain-containing protein n=1 Tax=Bondarzewia mesenterica TaxID=1095465 RepID=A0A4S4LCY2_9AGAM|nr:hypothetical protein EW146_g8680 [Bondarzewia mesenterica]
MDCSIKNIIPYARTYNPPHYVNHSRMIESERLPSILTMAIPNRCPPAAKMLGGADEELEAPAAAYLKHCGRRLFTLLHATCESIWRQNYWRIEKARRMKINDMLATLCELIQAGIRQGDVAEDDDNDKDEYLEEKKKQREKKQDEKEKEFKLEVLEKTIVYVKELKEKVRLLEETPCRKHIEEDKDKDESVQDIEINLSSHSLTGRGEDHQYKKGVKPLRGSKYMVVEMC